MESSKQWLKDNKILPKISFEKNEPRVVKLIDDKLETITSDGKEVHGMKYKVVEKGTPKTIFTSSVALISFLAEHSPGETVRILQKGYKDGNDFKTTYEVAGVKMGDEEIPIAKERGEEQNEEPRKVAPTVEGSEVSIDDLPF